MKLKCSTIIYGYTKTGKEVARILEEKGIEFILIHDNEDDLNKASKDGFESIEFDLTQDENLVSIGIGSTLNTLFVFHKTDSINLFVTLSARNLDPKLNIITLTENPLDKKKMRLAGANRIISPYEIGAHHAFRILKHPNIIDVIDNALYRHSDINIFEVEVLRNSSINGKFTKEIYLSQEYNLVVIGIKDKEISDEFIFYSAGINHKIDEGDVIVVIGHLADVERFKEEMIWE